MRDSIFSIAVEASFRSVETEIFPDVSIAILNLLVPYTPPTDELPLTFEFVTVTAAFTSVLCSPVSVPTYVSALILNLSIFTKIQPINFNCLY